MKDEPAKIDPEVAARHLVLADRIEQYWAKRAVDTQAKLDVALKALARIDSVKARAALKEIGGGHE